MRCPLFGLGLVSQPPALNDWYVVLGNNLEENEEELGLHLEPRFMETISQHLQKILQQI